MIIPFDIGRGITRIANLILYHHLNTAIPIMIILAFVLLFGAGLIWATNEENDRLKYHARNLGAFFTLICSVAIFVGVFNSSSANDQTIMDALPAIKHSNVNIEFNKTDQSYHGAICVQKWGNKIINISYDRPDRLKLTPINNVGKATLTMANYLKKYHVKKNMHMYITRRKVTAKHEDFNDKYSYTVNTDRPNKVIKESDPK